MDITKCSGDNCPIKQSCYRFTAKADDYQYYFVESPIKDGKCEMYWGKENEIIMNQLTDILNPKQQ